MVIDVDVARLAHTFQDDVLEQMGCADKAHEAAGTADCRIYLFRSGDAVGNEDVANAFARKAEGLAVGIANDRVAVKLRYIENGKAIVNDFTVRFIGNEVNGMADFLRFSFEEGGQLFIRFGRIDDA